jgi:hypothetical protein
MNECRAACAAVSAVASRAVVEVELTLNRLDAIADDAAPFASARGKGEPGLQTAQACRMGSKGKRTGTLPEETWGAQMSMTRRRAENTDC